jgi:hypothetical protein
MRKMNEKQIEQNIDGVRNIEPTLIWLAKAWSQRFGNMVGSDNILKGAEP